MGLQSTRPKARVKSIQYGSVILNGVTSSMSTINAVDPAKSVLLPTGWESDVNDVKTSPRLAPLTSSTNVTATRQAGAGSITTVGFVVVEFF